MDDILWKYQPVVCGIALVLGLCVGSFLNVLALRSLSGESIVWPGSRCPQCKHPLSILDNIPLFSFLLLKGRCRYCQTAISKQYVLVEAFTALTFVLLTRVFLYGPPLVPHDTAAAIFAAFLQFGARPASIGLDSAGISTFVRIELLIGALLFASTLIAVTVTDLREKLIPHEITYPSMILGIAFSAFVRNDLLGAMAGIGASYIIFDFLAFYGLKMYMKMHGEPEELEAETEGAQAQPVDDTVDATFNLSPEKAELKEDDEPLEVMGGGDAVLSAVMSAYLGWQLLAVALIIGFMIGTVAGLGLLINEMRKAKILHNCRGPMVKWAAIVAFGFALFGLLLGVAIPMMVPGGTAEIQPLNLTPALVFGSLGLVSGAVIGLVTVGTSVSKPYPFGPALAAGGFVALFLLPNWLALHQ